MPDYAIALLLMFAAQQCRVVYEFAVNRPDYWRGPKWMMIADEYTQVGPLEIYWQSPAKYFSWGAILLGIFAGAVHLETAIATFGGAILTFDVFYEWLYVKPIHRS